MTYRTWIAVILTSGLEAELQQILAERFQEHSQRLTEVALKLVLSGVSPTNVREFEQQLAESLRELGRQVLEEVYNRIEPEEANQLPHHVWHEAGGYRRLNKKTRNKHVSTLFGNIALWRYGYRYWHRDTDQETIFPLEVQLGLIHSATPALAEATARYMAEAGATQATVLDRLKREHGVSWGADLCRSAELTRLCSGKLPPTWNEEGEFFLPSSRFHGFGLEELARVGKRHGRRRLGLW